MALVFMVCAIQLNYNNIVNIIIILYAQAVHVEGDERGTWRLVRHILNNIYRFTKHAHYNFIF